MAEPAWADWISRFQAYSDGIISPDIYRLWSAITAIGGALERRVWVTTARSRVYPNLYTLLVGPPGTGKTEVIKIVEEMWNKTKSPSHRLRTAPRSMTKAAMVDSLMAAKQTRVLSPTHLYEYHSLLVACSELGVLISAHDLEFLSTLNDMYDCPDDYREQRRHNNKGKEISITKPNVVLLAGSQPGFLASLLPEEAWSMGFTSRTIMIYAGAPPIQDLFPTGGQVDERLGQKDALIGDLISMMSFHGNLTWEIEAEQVLNAWSKSKCPPTPTHSKLQNYNTRRILHTIKLCIISAVSRTGHLHVEVPDVNRARDWLLEAEQLMPDIFREMVAKSDTQIISELHQFIYKLYITGKKAPVHESRIWNFLKNRVPSEKVPRIIEVATKSNIIERAAGLQETAYIPRPPHEHGVE